jgi:DHA2 family multidrug resistance protein
VAASVGARPLALQLAGVLVGQWRVLLAVLPGVGLAMLNSTALDVPRADLIDALDSDRYRIQWIMGSYLLGSAAGMALTRLAGERLGLRAAYLWAVLLFALAGSLCGELNTVVWMTPFRLLQGLGMGLLVSSGMVILWRSLPQQRELAMALYGMAVYLPALAGGSLGGWLTAWDSWRWIFRINLPLGLVVAGLAWRLLPAIPADEPAGGDDAAPPSEPRAFDWLGFALLLTWIVTLNVLLDMGQYWGWLNSPFFLPWLAGFALSFPAFVAWGTLARRPLIDLRPFALCHFALGISIKAIFSINLYVLVALLSAYMIDLRGYQWYQGALVLAPALASMFAGILAGIAAGTDANRKLRIGLGLAVMAAMTWLIGAADVYTSKYLLAALLAAWGAGAGLVIGPAMLTVFDGLTERQMLQSAGIFNIMRSLPAFVAGSLAVILLTRQTDAQFDVQRQTIQYNRPAVEETLRQVEGYFLRQGSDPARDRQAHALLQQWVQANARAWAFQNVLRCLAIVTTLGLVLLIFVARPPGLAGRSASRRNPESTLVSSP